MDKVLFLFAPARVAPVPAPAWAALAHVAILLCAASPAWAQEPVGQVLCGTPDVVDGDTIELAGRRIRLHGVDAPERGKVGYAESGAALAAFSADGLCCLVRGTDRYRRLVATCQSPAGDVAALLAARGLAYAAVSRRYRPEEDLARRDHRGLWSCRFDAPARTE